MEASEVLKTAWTAVREADLPESIHSVAFREAVRLIAPQTPFASSPSHRPPPDEFSEGNRGNKSKSNGGENGDGGGLAVTETEIYEKVVQQTGVNRAKLEQLIHLDNDTVKVSLPGIRLGKNNADKTRTVAQILTIVRGFGLEEDDTSVEIVRSEVQRLKCYDSANFSSQLAKLGGFVITGSGNNRRIRAKAPGIATFPGLVDELVTDQ